MHRPLAYRRGVESEKGAFNGTDQIAAIVGDPSDTTVNDVRYGGSAWHNNAEVREANKYRHHHRLIDPTESREVPLRIDHIVAAIDAARHPHARACANERDKRFYIGDGLIMTRDGRRLVASERMHVFIKRDGEPMAHAAIHMVNLIGLLPIAFRPVKIAGLGEEGMVPHVPDIHSFTITVRLVRGVQQYRFYWRNHLDYSVERDMHMIPGGDPDDRVIILSGYGYNPTAFGELTSNYYTIAERLNYLSEMMNLEARARRINSNPPIATEYDLEIEKIDSQRHFGSTSYVGQVRTNEDLEDECIEKELESRGRTARQVRMLVEQSKLWARMNGMNARTAFQMGKDGRIAFDREHRRSVNGAQMLSSGVNELGEDMPWFNIFNLPAGRRFHALAMPVSHSDLVQMDEQARSIVCSVMNTHEALIASSSRTTSGIETANKSMDENVRRWASIGANAVTLGYRHSMGLIDLKHYLQEVVFHRYMKNPEKRHIVTEDDIAEAKRRVFVQFEFDLRPATTQQNLERLYAWNLISEDRFGTAMLQLEGFGYSDMQRPLKLTDAERRQIILGAKETADGGDDHAGSAAKKRKKVE